MTGKKAFRRGLYNWPRKSDRLCSQLLLKKKKTLVVVGILGAMPGCVVMQTPYIAWRIASLSYLDATEFPSNSEKFYWWSNSLLYRLWFVCLCVSVHTRPESCWRLELGWTNTCSIPLYCFPVCFSATRFKEPSAWHDSINSRFEFKRRRNEELRGIKSEPFWKVRWLKMVGDCSF